MTTKEKTITRGVKFLAFLGAGYSVHIGDYTAAVMFAMVHINVIGNQILMYLELINKTNKETEA